MHTGKSKRILHPLRVILPSIDLRLALKVNEHCDHFNCQAAIPVSYSVSIHQTNQRIFLQYRGSVSGRKRVHSQDLLSPSTSKRSVWQLKHSPTAFNISQRRAFISKTRRPKKRLFFGEKRNNSGRSLLFPYWLAASWPLTMPILPRRKLLKQINSTRWNCLFLLSKPEHATLKKTGNLIIVIKHI